MISKDAADPYICNDLPQKEAWWSHEFKLAGGGVRAYTAIPLQARGWRVGVFVFSRPAAEAFTLEQMATLTEVSRAIAVAAANAMAWEENEKLRAIGGRKYRASGRTQPRQQV